MFRPRQVSLDHFRELQAKIEAGGIPELPHTNLLRVALEAQRNAAH